MAGIDTEGFEELNRMLDNMQDTSRIERAVGRGATLVQGQARMNCPVDTGTLRMSIDSSVEREGSTIYGVVSTNCDYAAYVEFGTGQVGQSTNSNDEVSVSYRQDPWVYTPDGGEHFYHTKGQPAQPYLYPALKSKRKAVTRIIKEAVLNNDTN